MSSICNGCHRSFSHTGYANHILQSSRVACRDQALRQLEQAQQLLERPREALMVPRPSQQPIRTENMPAVTKASDVELPPIAFEGDYFGDAGDYSAFDLGWVAEHGRGGEGDMGVEEDDEWPEDSSDDNSDEELDADMDESLQQHWEPAPQPLALPTQATDDIMENVPLHPGASQRNRMEAALRRPVIITPYTAVSALAGQPVLFAPSPPTGYAAYASALAATMGGDTVGYELKSPYHPFLSKLEWEIARWAKTRSPSSTALSELLGIEGVSNSCFMVSKSSYQYSGPSKARAFLRECTRTQPAC